MFAHSVSVLDPYQQGGVHGPKGDKPPSSWKKLRDAEGEGLGLSTKFETEALRNYLWANGQLTLKHVSMARHHSPFTSLFKYVYETAVCRTNPMLSFLRTDRRGRRLLAQCNVGKFWI